MIMEEEKYFAGMDLVNENSVEIFIQKSDILIALTPKGNTFFDLLNEFKTFKISKELIVEKSEITNEMCVAHIVNILKENGIKQKDIEIDVDGDFITFTYGDTTYDVWVEGPEDVSYCPSGIDGIDLNQDFWNNKAELEDYLYIEDYLTETVFEKPYAYIRKAWKALEKLESEDQDGDLRQIIEQYFGVY